MVLTFGDRSSIWEEARYFRRRRARLVNTKSTDFSDLLGFRSFTVGPTAFGASILIRRESCATFQAFCEVIIDFVRSKLRMNHGIKIIPLAPGAM